MSDWEFSEESCPKCGEQMAWRRCNEIGCGDDLEDDGFPAGICDNCNGEGYDEWCRECGWDNVTYRFLAPQYEKEWLEKQAASVETEKV